MAKRRSARELVVIWADRPDEDFNDFVARHERQREMFQRLAFGNYWMLRSRLIFKKDGTRAVKEYGRRRLPNNMLYRTSSDYRSCGAAQEFMMLKLALLVLVNCFDPLVALVRTRDFGSRFEGGGPFQEAWILYVPMALAPRVQTDGIPLAEPALGGGLFLAATMQAFQLDKPEHCEGARRIGAATRPLNVGLTVTTDALPPPFVHRPRYDLWPPGPIEAELNVLIEEWRRTAEPRSSFGCAAPT